MARHSGKNGTVKVGANDVQAVRDWSLTVTMPIDDTTAMGDSWQTHVSGIPGWTGTANVLFDPADTTGQQTLVAGASLALGLYSDGDAAGKTFFSGTATITEVGLAPNYQGAVMKRVSFTGNGALTEDVVGA